MAAFPLNGTVDLTWTVCYLRRTVDLTMAVCPLNGTADLTWTVCFPDRTAGPACAICHRGCERPWGCRQKTGRNRA